MRAKQQQTGRIMPQVNEVWLRRPLSSLGRQPEVARPHGRQSPPTGLDDGDGRRLSDHGRTRRHGNRLGARHRRRLINGRGDDSMVMLQGYGHMVDFFTGIRGGP